MVNFVLAIGIKTHMKNFTATWHTFVAFRDQFIFRFSMYNLVSSRVQLSTTTRKACIHDL